MTKTKWNALNDEAYDIDPRDPVAAGVNYVMAHAEDNADDEAGRIASIESILCYSSEYVTGPVRDWFTTRGIRF
jgi:hypothetical protein